jgi:hypothetical protein
MRAKGEIVRRVTVDMIDESETALRRLEARAPRGVSTSEIVRAAIIEKAERELKAGGTS